MKTLLLSFFRYKKGLEGKECFCLTQGPNSPSINNTNENLFPIHVAHTHLLKLELIIQSRTHFFAKVQKVYWYSNDFTRVSV